MRYSYEFKRKCVEMYRQGVFPETPEGVKKHSFHTKVQEWAKIEENCGPEALQHKKHNKHWTAEKRYELVARVIVGESVGSVAASVGIDSSLLSVWVRKYRDLGYNGLENMRAGRPPKDPEMKKNEQKEPRKIDESEYEELIRLRVENEYLKTENAVIKKSIALRKEKQAARLKTKKRRSSRNSVKKDTD